MSLFNVIPDEFHMKPSDLTKHPHPFLLSELE